MLRTVQDDHGGDVGHDKDGHQAPKVKNIQVVEFGKFEMDAWYYSPYPEPYASLQVRRKREHSIAVCDPLYLVCPPRQVRS